MPRTGGDQLFPVLASSGTGVRAFELAAAAAAVAVLVAVAAELAVVATAVPVA